jgi:hypothetical protein
LDFDAAYQALPAFDAPDGSPTPAEPSPAATEVLTDPALDEEDDGSLDLSVPERDGTGEDEEAPVDAAGAESDEGGDPEDDRDWLIERAKRADELEREHAAQQFQRQEQEAVAHWDQRLAQANAAFAARENVIYQNAESNLNPIAYLKQEMANLKREADAWYTLEDQNREQALGQFQRAREIPQFAARVAEHYKLPQEVVNDLLDYPPEQMEREAQKMRQRLIRERKTQRQIDQLKRKDAARKIAAATVAPGSGRAAGGGSESNASFEESYASIPWTRGR